MVISHSSLTANHAENTCLTESEILYLNLRMQVCSVLACGESTQYDNSLTEQIGSSTRQPDAYRNFVYVHAYVVTATNSWKPTYRSKYSWCTIQL